MIYCILSRRYAACDVTDMSQYGLGVADDGGGSDGQETALPASSIASGEFFYIASESTNFQSWFGFAPDMTAASTLGSLDGNDAIELHVVMRACCSLLVCACSDTELLAELTHSLKYCSHDVGFVTAKLLTCMDGRPVLRPAPRGGTLVMVGLIDITAQNLALPRARGLECAAGSAMD